MIGDPRGDRKRLGDYPNRRMGGVSRRGTRHPMGALSRACLRDGQAGASAVGAVDPSLGRQAQVERRTKPIEPRRGGRCSWRQGLFLSRLRRLVPRWVCLFLGLTGLLKNSFYVSPSG